jgi:hypothetical protein
VSNSTPKKSACKPRKHYVPEKPYPEFPLTPHARGTWCKCIRRKLYHFGRWARIQNGVLLEVDGLGWQEALEKYKTQVDDLMAGRAPRQDTDAATIKDLCNEFLNARRRMIGRELSQKQFNEYESAVGYISEKFGARRLLADLRPTDF